MRTMEKAALSYWDYVKAAFGWPVKLPLMGAMPLNKLILGGFAILGFGHPAFWLLGLAYETAYLVWLPGNPRFQRLVQATMAGQVEEQWEEREGQILARLTRDAQLRYKQLADRCQQILRAGESAASAMAGMDQLKAGDLNHMLWIFLNLLLTRQRIRENLDKTLQEDLQGEIDKIKQKLAREKPESAVAKSLGGTLEIQQRRLDNQAKASEGLRVTEAELYRIEKQIALIQEEIGVCKDPQVLSTRLDGVVKSLQETNQWMNENVQLLSTLEDEPPMPGRVTRGKVAE
ncbi:hypothetical protein LLG95_14945 [bacterium]|nr:hypothetical protein [bacterium]